MCRISGCLMTIGSELFEIFPTLHWNQGIVRWYWPLTLRRQRTWHITNGISSRRQNIQNAESHHSSLCYIYFIHDISSWWKISQDKENHNEHYVGSLSIACRLRYLPRYTRHWRPLLTSSLIAGEKTKKKTCQNGWKTRVLKIYLCTI